jgi:predicted TPR repeat methyltransferase
MDSNMERARFAATDALVQRTFGRLGSILELGCGEGHQTRHFAALADQVYGVDVSAKAVERARVALPQAQFANADIFQQPWGEERGRFDLVTACEVLYYMKDVDATIARMSHLGRNCMVTFFSPALRRMAPHLDRVPNMQKDWLFYGATVWLVCWWRND